MNLDGLIEGVVIIIIIFIVVKILFTLTRFKPIKTCCNTLTARIIIAKILCITCGPSRTAWGILIISNYSYFLFWLFIILTTACFIVILIIIASTSTVPCDDRIVCWYRYRVWYRDVIGATIAAVTAAVVASVSAG